MRVSLKDVDSKEVIVMELLEDDSTDELYSGRGSDALRIRGALVPHGVSVSEAGLRDGDVVDVIKGLFI